MTIRHFLTLGELAPSEAQALVARATALRKLHRQGVLHQPLMGKTLGMIFSKSSTRTRVSFEAGMAQLGGHALFLSPRDTQLGRGEPIADTAQVLSRMVDCVMIRNDSQVDQVEFAAHSQAPVINGLSDQHHPCQLLADIQAWTEAVGDISGKVATWVGDGNNVCNSWIEAAMLFDFQLRVACPQGYEPDPQLLASAGKRVVIETDVKQAADGADLLVTDVWASMGQEEEQRARMADFKGYQVDATLMALANPDARFMHCLPAHRGEEVSAEVIDGPASLVWDEAENRLHAQKALLEFLLLAPVQGE